MWCTVLYDNLRKVKSRNSKGIHICKKSSTILPLRNFSVFTKHWLLADEYSAWYFFMMYDSLYMCTCIICIHTASTCLLERPRNEGSIEVSTNWTAGQKSFLTCSYIHVVFCMHVLCCVVKNEYHDFGMKKLCAIHSTKSS